MELVSYEVEPRNISFDVPFIVKSKLEEVYFLVIDRTNGYKSICLNGASKGKTFQNDPRGVEIAKGTFTFKQ